jgi:hypothetical protein
VKVTRKKWALAVGSLGAAVILAAAGIGIGTSAFAQTGPEDRQARHERYIERLAEKLGVSSDELRAAHREVRDQLIDEALAAGNITAEQAERLKSMDAGSLRHIGPIAGERISRFVVDIFQTAADVVGVPVNELRDRLRSGESLAEIAADQGKSEDQLKHELVAAYTSRIDQALADGDISQELHDRLLRNLDTMVERAMQLEGLPGMELRDRLRGFGPR